MVVFIVGLVAHSELARMKPVKNLALEPQFLFNLKLHGGMKWTDESVLAFIKSDKLGIQRIIYPVSEGKEEEERATAFKAKYGGMFDVHTSKSLVPVDDLRTLLIGSNVRHLRDLYLQGFASAVAVNNGKFLENFELGKPLSIQ